MEVLCAECGCRVDAGVRLSTCGEPDCCCRDLPLSRAERYRALEAIAVDLDDEEDVETVQASLREARRTVAERRRAR